MNPNHFAKFSPAKVSRYTVCYCTLARMPGNFIKTLTEEDEKFNKASVCHKRTCLYERHGPWSGY